VRTRGLAKNVFPSKSVLHGDREIAALPHFYRFVVKRSGRHLATLGSMGVNHPKTS
jgi:hypothetical protein